MLQLTPNGGGEQHVYLFKVLGLDTDGMLMLNISK